MRVSDIREAKDSQTLQYNVVRVNGQRSVYLPILKQGGDSEHHRRWSMVSVKRPASW